jgi:hypothetical protein
MCIHSSRAVHPGSETILFLRTQFVGVGGGCTDKKGSKIFLIYKEFQKGAVEKSYMTKGLLIYD